MKIAIFAGALSGGGAELVMAQLAQSFAEWATSVDAIVLAGPRRDAQPGEAFRVVTLAADRALSALPELTLYLARMAPDVLVCTHSHLSLVAVAARGLGGVRTRLVLRESSTPTENLRVGFANRILRACLSAVYEQAELVVVPSRGVGEDLVERFDVSASKIVHLSNPLNVQRIRRQAGETVAELAGYFDRRVVLAVGRLDIAKDYPVLIQAFARVRQRRVARLLILGEGAERPRLVALVKQLGLEDDVALHGYVTNPFWAMAQADVFVLSSRYEGMPNSLLQAMVLEKPVVATDCRSGPREILQDGRWGRLVPVGDSDRLSEAIFQALEGGTPIRPLEELSRDHGAIEVAARYRALLEGLVAAAKPVVI